MSDPVIDVSKELFAPASFAQFEGTFCLPELSVGPDRYAFADSVTWTASLNNTGDALLLRGNVHGVGVTACARCLEPVSVTLDGELNEYFLLDAADVPENEDVDEYRVLPDDHRIELAQFLEAALILEMPNLPLCREDCLGLCPKCGANLNDGACGCEQAVVLGENNPFAVLKSLDVE